MPELLLHGCRITFCRDFLYGSVHVFPDGVTGYVECAGTKMPVFVVDGSRQYEWAISKSVAATRAVTYRR